MSNNKSGSDARSVTSTVNVPGTNIQNNNVLPREQKSVELKLPEHLDLPTQRPNIASLPPLVRKNANTDNSTNLPPVKDQLVDDTLLIKRENILPAHERPASPRDTTQISVHGVPLNRALVQPINFDQNSRKSETVQVLDPDAVIRPASPTIVLSMPTEQRTSTHRTTVRPIPPAKPVRVISHHAPRPLSPSSRSGIGTFSPAARTIPVHASGPQRIAVEPPKTEIPTTNSLASRLPTPQLPDYDAMPPEVQEQHRTNFITKYGLLRNAWPNYHIPDVTPDMSLATIHAGYDIYVRHIYISNDADKYKTYLVIGWLFIELVCSKLGLNIGGYTVNQMKSMNKYEQLLIELGETSYQQSLTTAGAQSAWPVEMRILFISLINAVAFIIIKMLATYIGEGMAAQIVDGLASFLTGSPPQPGQILFGNNNPPTSASPGSQPLPPVGQAASPFGGLDVNSMIASFGNMFINRTTAPAPTPAAATNNAAPANAARTKYTPAYND